MKTPRWVRWLYNNFGSKAQGWYDDIDSWDLPDWLKKSSQSFWNKLDSEMKEKLYDLAIVTTKKYDESFAKNLLDSIWKKLQSLFNK